MDNLNTSFDLTGDLYYRRKNDKLIQINANDTKEFIINTVGLEINPDSAERFTLNAKSLQYDIENLRRELFNKIIIISINNNKLHLLIENISVKYYETLGYCVQVHNILYCYVVYKYDNSLLCINVLDNNVLLTNTFNLRMLDIKFNFVNRYAFTALLNTHYLTLEYNLRHSFYNFIKHIPILFKKIIDLSQTNIFDNITSDDKCYDNNSIKILFNILHGQSFYLIADRLYHESEKPQIKKAINNLGIYKLYDYIIKIIYLRGITFYILEPSLDNEILLRELMQPWYLAKYTEFANSNRALRY